MIRRSKDLSKLTDEEFDSIVSPFDNKITNYITDKIVNDFVAYYISTAFDMDALWDENFDLTCESAIEMLYQIDTTSYNKDEVKKILKEKYKLEVTSEVPTEMRCINNE